MRRLLCMLVLMVTAAAFVGCGGNKVEIPDNPEPHPGVRPVKAKQG